MPPNSTFHRAKGTINLLVGSAIVAGVAGCASIPFMSMRAERYSIDVRLDPASHVLTGRTAIDMVRNDDDPLPPDRPVSVEIRLHPDLRMTGLRAGGVELRSKKATSLRGTDSARPGNRDDDGFAPSRYRVVLQRPVDAMTLFVEYEGVLFKDVAAGEKAGEIHNFAMRAHIGAEGVYLAEGFWYPQPAHKEDEPSLAD